MKTTQVPLQKIKESKTRWNKALKEKVTKICKSEWTGHVHIFLFSNLKIALFVFATVHCIFFIYNNNIPQGERGLQSHELKSG